MMRQKRMALINDITGFGRCSVAVELPLISAMKIQVCPLPTAILSVHTGFPKYFIDDYTDRMRDYMNNWKDNGLEFDGILTGFLGSRDQIDIVIDFFKNFKKENTKVIVDPVMGDHGRLYSSYTPELCLEMRRLLEYSDVLTPNLTEACNLLGIDYPYDGKVSEAELMDIAEALSEKGPSQVAITGIGDEEVMRNFIYEKGKGAKMFAVPKVGGERSGTGDAFSAIVSAALVNGESLESAVEKAASFISKVLEYAVGLDLPWNYGLPFEEYLTELK